MAGILVTRRTSPPERRMAVPVSAKGKQKPAASYSRAPRTGPTLKVRFQKSFFKMLRIILKTRQTVRPTLKLASHQAFTVAFRSGNLTFNVFFRAVSIF